MIKNLFSHGKKLPGIGKVDAGDGILGRSSHTVHKGSPYDVKIYTLKGNPLVGGKNVIDKIIGKKSK